MPVSLKLGGATVATSGGTGVSDGRSVCVTVGGASASSVSSPISEVSASSTGGPPMTSVFEIVGVLGVNVAMLSVAVGLGRRAFVGVCSIAWELLSWLLDCRCCLFRKEAGEKRQ